MVSEGQLEGGVEISHQINILERFPPTIGQIQVCMITLSVHSLTCPHSALIQGRRNQHRLDDCLQQPELGKYRDIQTTINYYNPIKIFSLFDYD